MLEPIGGLGKARTVVTSFLAAPLMWGTPRVSRKIVTRKGRDWA
jgi:hypothetical protein